MTSTSINKYKAFIRVVKSISENGDSFFSPGNEVLRIPIIEAKDKAEVKEYLKSEYPQFFQNNKVYERETKDKAQFFYVVIFPLYQWEIDLIKEGEWACASCGQIHENRYVSKPMYSKRLFGENILFCRSGDDSQLCLNTYKKDKYKNIDFPDDENYIRIDSANYIYKCTEKSTGKSYIGKTRNEPFFRWWNHLKHSSSPFGVYLRSTKLSDWTFEVLDVLPHNAPEKDIFKLESEYMLKFNSIDNGYNSLISNKRVAIDDNNHDLL